MSDLFEVSYRDIAVADTEGLRDIASAMNVFLSPPIAPETFATEEDLRTALAKALHDLVFEGRTVTQ